MIKKPPADAGDAGSVPQSGRSLGGKCQPAPVFWPGNPWTEESARLQSIGSQRAGRD